jgi:hypothetical protein
MKAQIPAKTRIRAAIGPFLLSETVGDTLTREKKNAGCLLYSRHFHRQNLRLGEARACTVADGASGERRLDAPRDVVILVTATQAQRHSGERKCRTRTHAAARRLRTSRRPAGSVSSHRGTARPVAQRRAGGNSDNREFSFTPQFQLGTVNSSSSLPI